MIQISWFDEPDYQAASDAMGLPVDTIDYLRCELQAQTLKVVVKPILSRPVLVSACIYSLSPHHILLHHFGTHRLYRRMGHGKALFSRLAGKLDRRHRATLIANVPESSLDAQLFFKSCGMRAALPLVTCPQRGVCYPFRLEV